MVISLGGLITEINSHESVQRRLSNMVQEMRTLRKSKEA